MSRPVARVFKFLWVIGVLASVMGVVILFYARYGPHTWRERSIDLKTRILTSIEEAKPKPDVRP